MRSAMLATVPWRTENLEVVVRDLLPQVDRVYTYLNGHERPPEICNHPRVTWGGTCAGGEDLGDAGKYAFAEDVEGYVFSVDDDVFYPEDYADRMTAKVEEYNREAVISIGGKRFDEWPVERFVGGWSLTLGGIEPNEKDIPVHAPLTGGLAYHTDTIRISIDDFPLTHRNMADLHFGRLCQRAGVPVIAAAHPEGWIHRQQHDLSRTISRRTVRDDTLQTEIVNQYEWE